jgi:voltage-gated potassium channel
VTPLYNFRRLFGGLGAAIRQPDVQGAAMLACAMIGVATIFYTLVEGWSLLDSAYFSVVTIATVGYGDFVPQTVLGKLFTIVYVFSGIGIFVAAVTALAHAVAAEPPPGE